MIHLLSLLKAKNLAIALLLLAYASTCVVPSIGFTKEHVFSLSGSNAMVNTSESSNLPFSIPLSTEQQCSDIEDKFSQEDESFINLSSISTSTTLDFRRFHYVNSPPLPGSINPPFSPPEILAWRADRSLLTGFVATTEVSVLNTHALLAVVNDWQQACLNR